VNILKSFVGLGILAAPSGYRMVGFIPATIMIIINGFVNTYTVHLQARVKEEVSGGSGEASTGKVKTYTDLGEVCFGRAGLMVFSATIMLNQIFTCTGYVKFFIEQLDILTR
jgi:amino acid permease